MTNELSELETIGQRIDDMIESARNALNTSIDEDYDWPKASGDAARLSDLLRVRAIVADYQ